MHLASCSSGKLGQQATHATRACVPALAVGIDDECDMGHDAEMRSRSACWRKRLARLTHRLIASASDTDSANEHPIDPSHVSCMDLFLW